MKGGGMDFSALAQQMGATMGGGGGGSGGGGGGGGGAAGEMERLRRENAMLKQHLGNKRGRVAWVVGGLVWGIGLRRLGCVCGRRLVTGSLC